MASFTYTARDSAGRPANGTLTAASVGEALQMIRIEGKYPVSVRPADQQEGEVESVAGGAGVKISRADVIQIATQLSIMIDTGVTLVESLDCIGKQVEKPQAAQAGGRSHRATPGRQHVQQCAGAASQEFPARVYRTDEGQ